jgi:hypothetical protein
MHAVIRRYTGAATLMAEMDRRPEDIERVIAAVPGFMAYHAVRAGDTLVTVSICRDREGTEETTRRAAQWVRDNLPAGSLGAPEITDGEAFLNFAAPQAVGMPGARV